MIQSALNGGQLVIEETVEFAQGIAFRSQPLKEFLQLRLPGLADTEQAQPTEPQNRHRYEPVFHYNKRKAVCLSE